MSAETDEEDVWNEVDEDERRARMRETELDTDEPGEDNATHPDAVSDPAELDWHAFARRYNFHLAGQGAQSRFASRSKIEVATEIDDMVAGGGESFVGAALVDESVPLVKDGASGRLLFKSEVLEQ